MNPQEVNSLLIKTFWLMSGNIDRIMAQMDMRKLSVANVAQGGEEAAKEYRQKLVVEAGMIVKLSKKAEHARDEQGFSELKELAAKLN
jgi:hypothetical protein